MTWIIVAFTLVMLPGCGRNESKNVLAKVGDTTISTDEFIRRYELTIHPQIPEDPPKSKQAFLEALIAEKLLATEGERMGLERAPRTHAFLEQIEKEALVEALIETEIKPAIKISEEELRQAFVRSKTEWDIEYVAIDDSLRLMALEERLSRGEKLAKAAQGLVDSVQHKTLCGGEADPVVEDVIAAVPVGAVSKTVVVDGTFYIFRLRNKRGEVMLTENAYLTARSSLYKKIHQRKLGDAYWEYSHNLLRHGKNFVVKHQPYNQLVEALYAAFEPGTVNPSFLKSMSVGERQMMKLAQHPHLDKTAILIYFEDGTSWTVGEVIAKLAVGPYPLQLTDKRAFRRSLQASFPRMALIETLAETARAKGLSKSDYVHREKKMWREAVLAEQMAQAIIAPITVDQSELLSYHEQNSSPASKSKRELENEILAAKQKAAIRKEIVRLLARYKPTKNMALLDSLAITTIPIYVTKFHFPGRPAVPSVNFY